MTRATFFKFLALSVSNLKKFLLINLMLLLSFGLFAFSLTKLVPVLLHYVDSLNISISYVRPGTGKLALVFVWERENDVYVFRRSSFNGLRKHVFTSVASDESARLLRARALSHGRIDAYREPIPLYDSEGEHLLTLEVKNVREGSIEFLFFGPYRALPPRTIALFAALGLLSFVALSGAFGGVTEYTQRVVFHEMKEFGFLIQAIRRNFFRSVLVSLMVLLVIGAVSANMYFYIFMLSTEVSVFIAALNFWMLVFFFIALLWSYPLIILNREESIWSVVKKSLYISFDNLEFTMRTLFILVLMGIISLPTLTLFPGIAGAFSFLNSALKDLSGRYTKADTA